MFEQFIAQSPPADDVQAARDVIAQCREVLGLGEAGAEPDAAPPPEPEPPPEDPLEPRWYADPLGGALLGGGLGVAVIGGGLYGAGFVRARDPIDETETEHDLRTRRVRGLSAAGVTLLATGGALIIAGVVRYAVVARRGRAIRSARRPPPPDRGWRLALGVAWSR